MTRLIICCCSKLGTASLPSTVCHGTNLTRSAAGLPRHSDFGFQYDLIRYNQPKKKLFRILGLVWLKFTLAPLRCLFMGAVVCEGIRTKNEFLESKISGSFSFSSSSFLSKVKFRPKDTTIYV